MARGNPSDWQSALTAIPAIASCLSVTSPRTFSLRFTSRNFDNQWDKVNDAIEIALAKIRMAAELTSGEPDAP